MALGPCIFVLASLYSLFIALGFVFFRLTARLKPFNWRLGNGALNTLRFALYVGLLPVGLTCATAIFIVYTSYSGN